MSQNLLPQARTAGIVTQDLPDEVLVYDLNTHKAHCLNHTAATVWKYCDGKTSVPEMTARMNKDLNQTIDEPTVWQALDRLGKASLLEDHVALPAGSFRLGRREAMRRIGLGSAIAVPIVMSVLAPTALAGCTFAPGGQGDGEACCVPGNCGGGLCCASSMCAPTGLGNGAPCTDPCQCTTSTNNTCMTTCS